MFSQPWLLEQLLHHLTRDAHDRWMVVMLTVESCALCPCLLVNVLYFRR
jgi:hypothetical protein